MQKNIATLLVILLMTSLFFTACSTNGELEGEQNEQVLEMEEGLDITPEFELKFKNMLYSVVVAKLLVGGYFELDPDEDCAEYEQEVMSAINRAQSSIDDFEPLAEELAYKNALNQTGTAWYDFILPSKAKAMPHDYLRENPHRDFEFQGVEITDRQRELYAARAFRGAPRGEGVDALWRASQDLNYSMADAREAVIDHGENRNNYRQGQVDSAEFDYKAAKVLERSGDVAMFALDVATGPVPTTFMGRALRGASLTLSGADTYLAVGEATTILMGDEEGTAILAKGRNALETPLTLISIHDMATDGINSVTDISSLPETLTLASEGVDLYSHLTVDMQDPDSVSIKHYHTDEGQVLLDEEQLKLLAQEMRADLIAENQVKLEQLETLMEETGIELEEAFNPAGNYEGTMTSVIEGQSMSYPFDISIDESGNVDVEFDYQSVEEVSQMVGVPDGAGQGTYISLSSSGTMSGQVDGMQVSASGSGSTSYSVEGYSFSEDYTFSLEGTIEGDAIIGTIISDGVQEVDFTATKQ